MRVSQSVGRYREMMELPLSVYWKYNAVRDGATRASHLKLDGMIRHRDDPFWKRNYPPNAWNCRCFVTAHSKRECEKNGWKISPEDEPLPEGFEVHPDWDYDVGAGAAAALETVEFQKTVKAIKGGVTDTEVAVFREVQTLFEEKNKTATLCTSAIFGKEKSVKLSSQTVQSHLHHKDITALDYSLIPLMLDGDKRIFAQSDTRYIVLTTLGIYCHHYFRQKTKEFIFTNARL